MSENNIGKRLVFERNRLGIKQIELSNLLKITPVTTRKYEQGDSPIPSDKLAILHSNGFDTNYIITGQTANVSNFEKSKENKNKEIENKIANVSNFEIRDGTTIDINDYSWIPLYDVKVSAGSGTFADNENIVRWLSFSEYSLSKRRLSANDLCAVIVHGDSMTETLKPNDCIIINLTKRDADGGIFVIRVGETIYVKRLIKEKDVIRVISDNPRYDTWSLDKTDDFEIIGKYEWLGRYAEG